VKYPLLTSLLLIVALAGFGWWLSTIGEQESRPEQAELHYPDYYASDLVSVRYNQDGLPQHRLKSVAMRHFADDDTTELEHPIFWQYAAGAAPWRVTATSATLYGNNNKIFMPGEVQIDHAASNGKRPYQITTSDLWAHPDSGYVSTKQRVQITSQGDWLHGVGLQGQLLEPVKIKLLSEVRGYHEID
jgi:lipopolysaccharide export system protein LptC